MRTLNQVNAHYQATGYSLNRNAKGRVEVSFEGMPVWVIAKGRTVAQVVETMLDMPWLERDVDCCELPLTIETLTDEVSGVAIRFTNGLPSHVIIGDTISYFEGLPEDLYSPLPEPTVVEIPRLTVRERAALATEQRRQADLLYTDDHFRRNGYGHYDSCPLPEATVVETTIIEPDVVITIQLGDGWSLATNHRGHCVEFDGYAVDVVPNSAVARQNIANGAYLTTGECCPVEPHYTLDEYGVEFKPAYLTESEYYRDAHLLEF